MENITRNKYLEALKVVLEYKKQIINDYNEIEKQIVYDHSSETIIYEANNLDIRIRNILCALLPKHTGKTFYAYKFITNEYGKKIEIKTENVLRVKDIVSMTESQYLQCRNFGKKSLIILIDFLAHAGLTLNK